MSVYYTKNEICAHLFKKAHIGCPLTQKHRINNQNRLFLYTLVQNELVVANSENVRVLQQKRRLLHFMHRGTHKGRISYRNTVFTCAWCICAKIHHAS